MISIIPKPLSVKEFDGAFELKEQVNIGGAFSDSKNKLAKLLNNCGIKTKISDSDAKIVFEKDNSLDSEEYNLDIQKDKVTITASQESGAFYAVQSIRQIALLDLAKQGDTIKIDCCKINDKPRFKHRAFMLDVGRHFFDKTVVKEFLDQMAMVKMNVFHWHLTEDQGWRIEIKKYPLLTTKGCVRKSTAINSYHHALKGEKHIDEQYGEGKFFTQEDVKEIVAYAQDLHINIIPEIDMPGHLMSAIACYPEISCEGKPVDVNNRWGVMDTIGCVGGDKFMPFIKDIIDEVTQLFPYEYFHIGGDEVPKNKWKVCPKCQAKIKELGLKNENDLQGWFNNQILEYLKTKDKKLIGWNEILEASQLADETIAQWWVKSAQASGVKGWLNKGNKIVISPCPYVYFDHFYSMKDLKKTYSLDLDRVGLSPKFESQVLGFEAPQWTEFVRDIPKLHFNTYPRLQAIAEIGWTAKKNKCYKDFDNRLQTYLKILDKFQIGYAPRECYRLKGLNGLNRMIKSVSQWVVNPYYELEHYTKK